ncbi:TetR family transcriptional regulator [Amycolatopsis sp. K13G38]|uniref:TetR family transcriptional regulator n=1 Tax=Amycolatopsis acididurans TaxID=2724524 RepID=A0ABX1IYU3_9PSEU|nr:TetR family transcriptional regulator [Amycolatopsis acididurans]NKQ52683.1 TetR family transcriptional regulator [Amycolatopsis acididurans]
MVTTEDKAARANATREAATRRATWEAAGTSLIDVLTGLYPAPVTR